jgi:hypothetical protein
MKQQFKVGSTVWRYLSDAYGARRFGVVKEIFLEEDIAKIAFEDEPNVLSMQMISQLCLVNNK